MNKPSLYSSFIAPNATVVGDVTVEKDASIWYGAVLRGDQGAITIGEGSNIQDNCVVHEHTTVGKDCTVGHGAILHGCTIGDNCLIGMGATILDGAVIGEGSIIGAGALVGEGKVIPPRSLVVGVPGKVIREVSAEQFEGILKNAALYVEEGKLYLD